MSDNENMPDDVRAGIDALMDSVTAAQNGLRAPLPESAQAGWVDGDGQEQRDSKADDEFDLVRLLTHDVPCGSFDHAEKIIAAGFHRTCPPSPESAQAAEAP